MSYRSRNCPRRKRISRAVPPCETGAAPHRSPANLPLSRDQRGYSHVKSLARRADNTSIPAARKGIAAAVFSSRMLFLPLCLLTLYASFQLAGHLPFPRRGYAAKEALRAIPFSRIHARPGNPSPRSRRVLSNGFSILRGSSPDSSLLYAVRVKTPPVDPEAGAAVRKQREPTCRD